MKTKKLTNHQQLIIETAIHLLMLGIEDYNSKEGIEMFRLLQLIADAKTVTLTFKG